MSVLEDFVPRVTRVSVDGREIEIQPLRIRQLPAFSRAIENVFPLLSNGQIAEAVARHCDEMIEAVAVATDVERDWLGELRTDVFLDLATSVCEVNADFFVRRLLPELERARERLEAAMANGIGEHSSPGSSSADTGSPKSSG